MAGERREMRSETVLVKSHSCRLSKAEPEKDVPIDATPDEPAEAVLRPVQDLNA